MTTALTLLLVASLVACVVLTALWKSTQLREVKALQAQRVAENNYESACQGLAISEAARSDERVRDEASVAALRSEIAALEGDLNACRNPDDVRDRLRKLLQSSVPDASTKGVGTEPFGAVSYGSTTES